MNTRLPWIWAGLALLVLALAGCGINVDGPRTPTVAASPTHDETAIALRASPTVTRTLAPSETATRLPSDTSAPTASATLPPSETPTVTATASLTVTATPGATDTLPPSPTRTPTSTAAPTDTATLRPTATRTLTDTATPTDTATLRSTATRTLVPSATATMLPSATPSRAPSITPRPSATPTETVAVAVRPSATDTLPPSATPTSNATATAVFTPTPAATNTPAPTFTPSALPTLDPGEGGGDSTGLIATWTPSPTPGAVAEVPTGQAGEGAFVDPNAPATGQESAPVAPEAPVAEQSSNGPVMPEEEQIVVSYVGEVVPYLSLVGVAGGAESSLGQGTIFDVSSAGQVATVGDNHWLTINGQPVVVSPASEYGPPANLSLGAVEWSPDARYVAMRVDDADPANQVVTNGGVWIYDLTDPANPRSRQIFRNGYPGLVGQRGDERVAAGVTWSPDGSRLVIPVTTWYEGADSAPGIVIVSRDVDVNDPDLDPAAKVPLALPFGGATWTLDGTALIVSGPASGGASVVGRWDLATGQYTEYTNQGAAGVAIQAAAELPDGWIGFLGSATPGRDVALYLLPAAPGAPMSPAVSPIIPGEVIAAEWNPAHTAIMVLARTDTGDRLWLVQSNGTAQDITPPGGAPASIDWR
ncbi:hypothetical protein [Aggregatilinea lenta]|uniref:hypothetical protein n=1 Tax=Aggregatilinea lenta TaxID=913108 RepID=UPI000E5B2410|nr:hypothetical protein [Aggregatilinea lenta]